MYTLLSKMKFLQEDPDTEIGRFEGVAEAIFYAKEVAFPSEEFYVVDDYGTFMASIVTKSEVPKALA
jgi:hypothetical protein